MTVLVDEALQFFKRRSLSLLVRPLRVPVSTSPHDPFEHRPRDAAHLGGNRFNGRPQRRVVASVLSQMTDAEKYLLLVCFNFVECAWLTLEYSRSLGDLRAVGETGGLDAHQRSSP